MFDVKSAFFFSKVLQAVAFVISARMSLSKSSASLYLSSLHVLFQTITCTPIAASPVFSMLTPSQPTSLAILSTDPTLLYNETTFASTINVSRTINATSDLHEWPIAPWSIIVYASPVPNLLTSRIFFRTPLLAMNSQKSIC